MYYFTFWSNNSTNNTNQTHLVFHVLVVSSPDHMFETFGMVFMTQESQFPSVVQVQHNRVYIFVSSSSFISRLYSNKAAIGNVSEISDFIDSWYPKPIIIFSQSIFIIRLKILCHYHYRILQTDQLNYSKLGVPPSSSRQQGSATTARWHHQFTVVQLIGIQYSVLVNTILKDEIRRNVIIQMDFDRI